MTGSYRIFSSALILCAVVLAGAGCQETPVAADQHESALTDAQVLQPRPISIEQDAYAFIDGNSVVLEDSNAELIATVVANEPRELVWNEQESVLYWIESSAVAEDGATPGAVVRAFDLRSGAVRSIYWSRFPIERLSISPTNQFMAFEQQDTLFVLSVERGEIRQVAKWVEHVTWSPSDAALVVSHRKSTEYVSLQDDATIASRTQLAEGSRFTGATFLDAKTILGLRWRESDVVLWEIDLLTSRGEALGNWSKAPTDIANDFFALHMSPDRETIAVMQNSVDGNSVLWLWSTSNRRKVELAAAQQFLGWVSGDRFWYAVENEGATGIDEFNLTSDSNTTVRSGVDAPIAITYTKQ